MMRYALLAFLLIASPALAQSTLDPYRPNPATVPTQAEAPDGTLAPPAGFPPPTPMPIPAPVAAPAQQVPQEQQHISPQVLQLPPQQNQNPTQIVTPPSYVNGGFKVEAPVAPGEIARPQVGFDDWMTELRQDAVSKGIRPQTVYYVLNNVVPDPRIVEKDQKQPENTRTAQQYWDGLLSDDRIEHGREFYLANKDLLRRVSESYSVRSKYIVALLGIESNYGSGQGKENIINALVTLAYDGRRSDYFREELFNAMRIIDAGNVRPENMIGSWAGAMGYCQFMPSSYLKFAQDYDNDGKIDIWGSIPDAAASTANYLHQSGWHVAEEWGQEVTLSGPVDAALVGPKVRKTVAEWRELGVIKQKSGKKLPKASTMASLVQPDGPEGRSFLVYNNFYVLMRWNKSTYFAIAVGMLADTLGGR